MSLVALFIWIVLIGLLIYVINTFLPIPAQFKTIILVVGIIVVFLMVLQAFGLLGTLTSVRVPQVR